MAYRIVRCPSCGKYRRTSSLKSVKCFFCGRSFSVKKQLVSDSSYTKAMNKEVDFR